MDMNFIISMFSSYHLTSQNTQILGSFGEQLTYFSQPCFLPPITIGNSKTLTRLTNPTHIVYRCLNIHPHLYQDSLHPHIDTGKP